MAAESVDVDSQRRVGPTRIALGVLILVGLTTSFVVGAWFLLTAVLGNPTRTYARLEESLDLFAVPEGFEFIAEERGDGFGTLDVVRVYVTVEPADAACSQARTAFESFATQIARAGEACSLRGNIGSSRTALIRVVEGPAYGHNRLVSRLAQERPIDVAMLLRVTDPNG